MKPITCIALIAILATATFPTLSEAQIPPESMLPIHLEYGIPVDESLASPHILALEPYEENEEFIFMHFTLVPDAVSYRIFRERMITVRLATPEDETTGLVRLDEPEAVFVPWAKVDAVPGAHVGKAVIASLDNNTSSRWAVSAEVERDGTIYLSPLSIAEFSIEPSPTAVEAITWGALKEGVQ